MELSKLLDVLERLAPRALAEEWDNPGLLIEPEKKEITKALVALDCTPAVAKEAAARGAELVLTHHPLFFKPVRRVHYSEPETAAAYALIRNGIGLFAAHTNLDSALGGVNDALAAAIGLDSVRGLLSPDLPLDEDTLALGRIGTLPQEMTLQAFAAHVRGALGGAVRVGGELARVVRRVAVIGGSGGSFLADASNAGADALLTGEIKHDQALAAQVYGLAVVEAGHYETERLVLQPWIEGLQRALKEIQCNVEFMRAETDRSPLIAP